jgi:hypothetical protein
VHLLYIDESGDLGAMPGKPRAGGEDQPVFVLGSLIVDAAQLESLTHHFLNIKSKFYPGLPYPSTNYLDKIIPEIKGADVRRNAMRGTPRQKRHAIGFLDKLMAMLKTHHVKLLARIWVKGLGLPFDGRAVYTSSIQWLYSSFNSFLTDQASFGFCIADSRDYLKNVNVAHPVFTQKFRASSPVYGRTLELPVFGHSENHACIQVCDIVCSAFLFPIATYAYCTGHVANVHVQPDAAALRQRFGADLKDLQYRYREPLGKWNGGIVVADPLGQQNASRMFR